MRNHFCLSILLGKSTDSRTNRTNPSRVFLHTRREILRFRLGQILFLFSLATMAPGQEFVPERSVFPITDFKPEIRILAPLSIKFGTGFCLDPECRFVGTNYHVAKLMGKYVRIKGVFSAQRYLDSDSDDVGAEDVGISLVGGLKYASIKYNVAHDLAIYEMRRPLKGFRGVAFDADDLENNPEVDIYAYPFNGNPKRGLVCWHGKFLGKARHGLLAFSYEQGRVRGGASGGIVVDSKTKKIVGILSATAEDKDRIAFAVPVKELSNFVARAQPYLQSVLFPKTVFVSPIATDFYPPYVWPRSEVLTQRDVEPPEVVELRRTAQTLAGSMRYFVATETLAWGRDNREAEAADSYETLIVDGSERWAHASGKKFYDEVPFPPLANSVVPGAEWSELPRMVGTELNLKIHHAPDVIIRGRTIHVFQYAANVEDKICSFRSTTAYGLFERSSTKFYDCHGEVWIDESGNILRISEGLDLSGPWYRLWAVITYGWLEKDGRQYPVPVTFATQAEHNSTYWCRGLFTDYEMFGVKARLVQPTEEVQESAAGGQ